MASQRQGRSFASDLTGFPFVFGRADVLGAVVRPGECEHVSVLFSLRGGERLDCLIP